MALTGRLFVGCSPVGGRGSLGDALLAASFAADASYADTEVPQQAILELADKVAQTFLHDGALCAALTPDAARAEVLTAVDPSGQHVFPASVDAIANAVCSVRTGQASSHVVCDGRRHAAGYRHSGAAGRPHSVPLAVGLLAVGR